MKIRSLPPNKRPVLRKRELIILLPLLLVGIGGCLFLYRRSAQTDSPQNRKAVIFFDGKEERMISLSPSDENASQSFTIRNISFLIDANGIQVTDSPCSDKICIHTGAISQPGQAIICLPERMAVQIYLESENLPPPKATPPASDYDVILK